MAEENVELRVEEVVRHEVEHERFRHRAGKPRLVLADPWSEVEGKERHGLPELGPAFFHREFGELDQSPGRPGLEGHRVWTDGAAGRIFFA